MKVRDLIKILSELDGDLEVITQMNGPEWYYGNVRMEDKHIRVGENKILVPQVDEEGKVYYNYSKTVKENSVYLGEWFAG